MMTTPTTIEAVIASFTNSAPSVTATIMARMGHDNPRAALIYQHANREADQAIAAAIDQAVELARSKPR